MNEKSFFGRCPKCSRKNLERTRNDPDLQAYVCNDCGALIKTSTVIYGVENTNEVE